MVIRLMCGCSLQFTDSWNDAGTGTYHTMHGQLQTCSSVTEASTVSGPLAWMAFSGFESIFFCPIVNIATYTSVNVIFVYVSTIYFPYKVVTKFRFQCSIFYFGYMLSRVLWARLSHDSN